MIAKFIFYGCHYNPLNSNDSSSKCWKPESWSKCVKVQDAILELLAGLTARDPEKRFDFKLLNEAVAKVQCLATCSIQAPVNIVTDIDAGSAMDIPFSYDAVENSMFGALGDGNIGLMLTTSAHEIRGSVPSFFKAKNPLTPGFDAPQTPLKAPPGVPSRQVAPIGCS